MRFGETLLALFEILFLYRITESMLKEQSMIWMAKPGVANLSGFDLRLTTALFA